MRINSRILREAKELDINAEEHLGAAESLLKILRKVLTDELQSAILRSESEENIKTPDFAVTQANLLGYRKALRFTLSLIETKE